MRVALVVMPFAAANRPSLAVGLLQAGLRRSGIECDAKYFNVAFSRLLGPETYHTLCRDSVVPLAGDWVFSQILYGERISAWESYEREVLGDPVWGMPKADRPAVRAALEAAPGFLRLAAESTDWSRYDLVGFTSTFAQTLASLCLARAIRERHPRTRIALGGANFEGAMGRPYLEHFDFVDFVSTGEADHSFPELCRRLGELKAGQGEELEVPPGFLYRRRGEVLSSGDAAPVVELEDLPTPDYGDFYRIARASHSGNGNGQKWAWLPIETSRGCWWGQKAHCTFCGLNGGTMAFRRKSWRRVVEEVDELTARYGEIPLQFADNILSMSYFQDLLPYWAGQPRPTPKFFELKANVRRSQVRLLRQAGIRRVQPGIESFLDSTLRLMRKGVTGAQNLAFLRWCAEEGLVPSWNVLYGFPGEDLDEYPAHLGVLRKLTHLGAPRGAGPIRLDRFSPNFVRWRELGFTAITPAKAYRHIFPFDAETRAELAYFFEYEQPQAAAAMAAGAEIDRFVHQWQQRSERGANGELAVKPHWQGGFVLIDKRFNFPAAAVRLGAPEMALALACDAPAPREQALRQAAEALAPAPAAGADVEAALERMLERSVIVELSSRLVTLALLPSEELLAADRWWTTTTRERLRRADAPPENA